MQEQIAPIMACVIFWNQAYGGGQINYISNSQLFKCTIQFENSLGDRKVY